MKDKLAQKENAVKMRKQGKTYNEILNEVPVAKSTLSLWLREVGLSKGQKQTLTDKRVAAQKRGAARRHEMRLVKTAEIHRLCKKDIKSISKRELFLVGIALYWAEGSKSTGNKTGVMVDFGNSDPQMLKLFIKWLRTFANVTSDDFTLRLHLHENHKSRESEIIKTWSEELGESKNLFTKTLYKKHNPKTNRTKVDNSYIGLVSVRVKKSTDLNLRILGWIYAIIATQK